MKKTLGLVFIALLFVFCLGTVSGQKNVALVANTIDYNLNSNIISILQSRGMMITYFGKTDTNYKS
ncbi:MAG TPA: hypothetical protein PLQ02_07625, partial [Methanofastidiosum sp.]|nr:hypothetical protein [Methanofastidiosum sp.]